MRSNAIGTIGAMTLFQAIAGNQTLTDIDLSGVAGINRCLFEIQFLSLPGIMSGLAVQLQLPLPWKKTKFYTKFSLVLNISHSFQACSQRKWTRCGRA